MQIFRFEELKNAPLIIDAIYEGQEQAQNISSEPLHVLLPRTSNQGGFRITHRNSNMKLPAYVVIYTSMVEQEWPDNLDVENGILRYYGDNRHPGRELHDTRKRGNILLRDVFQWLNEDEASRQKIPPFLLFKKAGRGRDVQFLGLAVPGNANISPDKELISFWRTMDGQRFQNYEAYFTILDSQDEMISKEWLRALIYDNENSIWLAPKCWKDFLIKGRSGINPLKAPKVQNIPSKADQIPSTEDGKFIIETIRNYYKENSYGFENCAVKIIQMMDSNFYEFELTRPWRDGGRDAIGKYHIGIATNPLVISCALEAKCFSDTTSVGVKGMSRLISRIKYREFGILVTTSYVDKQAYGEVIEDGHPILIVNAKNIVDILKRNCVDSSNVINWLNSIDDQDY